MVVWSIGRLASPQVGYRCEKLILAALQDNYWKVRAAACTAISNFGG